MSTTTQAPLKLQVNRLIKAPRERVFAAWTTPSDIMKWMGCGDSKALSADVDLKVGGKYVIRMASSECGTMEVNGVYTEIKKPSRLAFTWGWEESDSSKRIETRVTIDLIDQNGSTEVKVTHEGFTDADSCAKHEFGWNACLEKMEKLA
jgi:glutathione S-transferase